MPEAARVCLDVTSGALHAYERLKLSTSQRAFSSIENSACMGEALMASLGIRLASNLPTLTLVGDWGYCMAPSEIHTAVELGLDPSSGRLGAILNPVLALIFAVQGPGLGLRLLLS